MHLKDPLLEIFHACIRPLTSNIEICSLALDSSSFNSASSRAAPPLLTSIPSSFVFRVTTFCTDSIRFILSSPGGGGGGSASSTTERRFSFILLRETCGRIVNASGCSCDTHAVPSLGQQSTVLHACNNDVGCSSSSVVKDTYMGSRACPSR